MEQTKVYMFYGREADLYPGRRNTEDLQLYGFTNDKHTVKIFRKMRKMEIFTQKTIYMTEREYSDFCRNSRECLIEMSPIDTITSYPKMGESIGRQSTTISLPLTFVEFQTIKDYQDNFMQADWFDNCVDGVKSYKWIPYGIFTKDIIKALVVLEYPQFMQLFMVGGDDSYFYGDNEHGIRFPYAFQQSIDMTDSEFDMPNVWIDELAILYRVYGHTLNKKIFIK